MNPIIWTEQNEFFGLDYSSKKGTFHDYEFDIRYDCDGELKVKPENCGLYLTVFKNKNKVASKFGFTIEALVKFSENYLLEEQKKFL
jgi:hypothetical protein